MANNEIGTIKGTVYQATFVIGTGGTPGTVSAATGSASTRLTVNSKILGVVRQPTTVAAWGAGVVQNTPVSVILTQLGADVGGKIASTLAGTATMTLFSALAADTSSVIVYWCNEAAANAMPA